MKLKFNLLPSRSPAEVSPNVAVALSPDKVQELFEKQFGKDQATRTRRQWKALVKQYGMKTVMGKENMNEAEIKGKCKK